MHLPLVFDGLPKIGVKTPFWPRISKDWGKDWFTKFTVFFITVRRRPKLNWRTCRWTIPIPASWMVVSYDQDSWGRFCGILFNNLRVLWAKMTKKGLNSKKRKITLVPFGTLLAIHPMDLNNFTWKDPLFPSSRCHMFQIQDSRQMQ